MFGSICLGEPALGVSCGVSSRNSMKFSARALPGPAEFARSPPGTFPAINVGSTDAGVTVYLFAPGIDPKQLDISIQQNVLSISGAPRESWRREQGYVLSAGAIRR